MNQLSYALGLSSTLAFHDVYSLTDPTLLSFLSRPALALLFVFPATPAYLAAYNEEQATIPTYRGSGANEPVIWFKQTIGNACGLIGLLHCVCNGVERESITSGSELDRLLEQAIPLTPDRRAKVLEDSDALEAAHMAAARTGDSAVPDVDAHDDMHYLAFVRGKDGCLWELEGGSKGPVKRGALEEGEDMLSERALEKGVRKFFKREEETGSGEMRFSVLMLGPSLE